MKNLKVLAVAGFTLVSLLSCSPKKPVDTGSIATDSVSVVSGQAIFADNCSGCHNFRQDGIGPSLGGITASLSPDGIKTFVRNPKASIDAGDERAKMLAEKYKAVMPSFPQLREEELNQIISFLHTQKEDVKIGNAANDSIAIKDPIPETVKFSGLVVDLAPMVQLPPSSDQLPRTRITKLDYQPETGNLFVVDLRGKLYRLDKQKPEVYMDMAKLKPDFIDKPGLATGFGSFAFHPEFSKNGLLYTTHTESPKSHTADFGYADSIKATVQWVVTEWKTKTPGSSVFQGESRELFRVNMVSGIHGVQEIAFNPQASSGDEDFGLLYVCIGDGGAVENGYGFLAHSREKVWGTILRIDPAGKNSANGHYGIPSTNPFARSKEPNVRGEIFAYGFRNPHRICWTRSGQILSCNVGHGNIEALNIILKGHDYGWPIREGRFALDPVGNLGKVYPLPSDDNIYNITYPVAQYDHDDGKAISGGFEYSGSAVSVLSGKYLFGDIPTGRLLYVEMSDLKTGGQAPVKEWRVSINGVEKDLVEICGSKRVDVHFGKDSRGEMYLMTKPDGKIYRLGRAHF